MKPSLNVSNFPAEVYCHLKKIFQRAGRPSLPRFREILLVDKIPSTNRYAWELYEKGSVKNGTVIVANSQTAGRGRFGRKWFSSPKGLYASFVFIPDKKIQVPFSLTAACAIAAARTIRDSYDVPARIRWPNDVVVDRKKIAGILVETKENTSRPKAYILGMGVNLNQDEGDFPAALKQTATSLKMTLHKDTDRAAFTAQLIATLSEWLELILEEQYDTVSAEWRNLSAIINKRVELAVEGVKTIGRVVDVHLTDGLALELDAGPIKVFRSESVEQLREL